jgi:hypothetical protein
MKENVMDMPDIDKIVKRTARHAYEDGIGEVYFGVIVALVGLGCVAEAVFKAPIIFKAPLPSFWAIVTFVVVLSGWLLGRWLVPAVKRRLVYPRTGFVAYRKLQMPRRWLVWGVACFVSCLMMGLMAIVRIKRPASMEWLALGLGIVVSAFLLSLGFWTGLRRFWILAGFSVLAGMAASLSGLGEGVYFVAMGLAVAAGGALALRSYLRQAPNPQEQ